MIQKSNFNEVYYYWSTALWPKRESPIEKTSAIDPSGKINCNLLNNPVWFYKFAKTSDIQGVISVQQTDDNCFRTRGIWVREDLRGKGLGKELIIHVAKLAKNLGAEFLWTMPRKTAVNFYLNLGFKIYNETDEYEFGKHYLAMMDLKRQSQKYHLRI